MISTYMVSDDNSLMNAKLWKSYTELMWKDPIFVYPRVNPIKLKDVGKIDLNIQEKELIADPAHKRK